MAAGADAGVTGEDLDNAVLASAMRLAGEVGWTRMSVPAAARIAGLNLADVQARMTTRLELLQRLGRVLDRAALADVPQDGSLRDRLFDVLMRRFDALQPYREGVLALMRALPLDPPALLGLTCDTGRSMRWTLEAVGVNTSGFSGNARVQGLVAVWLVGLRTWRTDESADLSATMAAVDVALARADRAATWLDRITEGRRSEEPEAPTAPGGTEGGVADVLPEVLD